MSRLHVDLPPTKLLLRLTEHLLAQHIFSVETTFPSRVLLCEYNTYQSHRELTVCYSISTIYSTILLFSVTVYCRRDQKERRSSDESIHADA